MSILNDITFKENPNNIKLSDTPAKLKLRNKTLSGINYNMSRYEAINSIFSIPSADLAKKKKAIEQKKKEEEELKKKKEEKPKEVVNEVTEKEEEKMINATQLVNPEVVGKRPLKVSESKFAVIENNGKELMKDIPFIATKEKEEEIPSVEVPEFSVEQGVTGMINRVLENAKQNNEEKIDSSEVFNKVEEKDIVEEKEEAPIIPEVQEETYRPAMIEANEDESYAKIVESKKEVEQVRNEYKETNDALENARKKLADVTGVHNQLSKTKFEKEKELEESRMAFLDAVRSQAEALRRMKEDFTSKNIEAKKNLDETIASTDVLEKENETNEKAIEEANNKISKFRNLREAVVSSVDFNEKDEDMNDINQKRLMSL